MIQASQPEIGASQNLRFGVHFPLGFPMEKSELFQRGVVQEEGQLSQGA